MSASGSGVSRFSRPHTDGVRSVQSECSSPSPLPAKRRIAPKPLPARPDAAPAPLSGYEGRDAARAERLKTNFFPSGETS